jgi:hypothetical protein
MKPLTKRQRSAKDLHRIANRFLKQPLGSVLFPQGLSLKDNTTQVLTRILLGDVVTSMELGEFLWFLADSLDTTTDDVSNPNLSQK